MADEAKTPVAIRITRPYADEDEFLARELDTLTRTSIVLLGAQQRPQGVVLRFEVVLTNGAPLVRGEGRVVAFKERAFDDLAGLTLRFTRLDSRSKALVDRAAAIRDARSRPPPAPRAPSAPPPTPSPQSAPLPVNAHALDLDLEATRAEGPQAKRSDRPPPASTPAAVPAGPVMRARTGPPPLPSRPAPPRPSPSAVPPSPLRVPPSVLSPTPAPTRVAPPAPPVPLDLESTHAEGPRPHRAPSERPPAPVAAPPPASDRDALLQRLRVRRSSLDEDTVKALLARKPER